MKIKVIYIGKTKKDFLEAGEKEYLSRLKHYIPIELIEIKDIKNQNNLTKDQIKSQEGRLFLSKIENSDAIYLLDEKGKEYTSIQFSKFLQQNFIENSSKDLVLIIGGAYGFSEEIYAVAMGKISFSKLTFSHQMIRMILFEQLYRAMTILKGEPYHHE